ncbi:AGAP002214-PA-like protein [Anopheles sinensis]|uniref:AGAP002214-PA-like protein n=1 Tax=Anopheles sinensis TaxID=74873 RepID=A0A084W111_ANOSI|nr:AGAP002214-PA-like protein [Anopheles sinensis]
MPTQKKKDKKVKEKSEPQATVNIKQEPEEIKPLAGYIDDRLELIRQVFSCVKPKEIKYLLPDFLEGKSNDVIKERCLDELLGISTKRLRSIINNTKCPTDTESENSDVENIEEHISLDEISSDSDDDAKRSGKRNKKAEKEMTVLELLELQARARAIRSQLALEPVTKIEIDSEHEEDGRHGDIDTDDEGKRGTHRRTATKDGAAGSSGENGKQMKQEQLNQQQPRRVRLKRNFRIRQVGDDDDGDQDTSSNPASESVRGKSTDNAVELVEPADTEPAVIEVREEQKSLEKETVPDEERESSPEVIPVEASPETLCISSDSEEERLAKQRASIFVPNIEELDRQAKEKPPPSPQQTAEDTEPEEGEISEDEAVVPPPAEEPPTVVEAQTEAEKEDHGDPSTSANLMESDENEANITEEGNEASGGLNKGDTSTEVEQTETTHKENEIHHLSSGSDESDTDSDGSSSSSSSEEEEGGSKVEQTKQLDTSAQDDADIVEIHDSGDENLLLEEKPVEEEEKSWNSRWLKSNRVAKVMAASRLGNKVREKLKKQKQKQQAEQQEQAATETAEVAQPSPKPAEATVVVPELPANVEVGSVEHYRELVAQQETSKD